MGKWEAKTITSRLVSSQPFQGSIPSLWGIGEHNCVIGTGVSRYFILLRPVQLILLTCWRTVISVESPLAPVPEHWLSASGEVDLHPSSAYSCNPDSCRYCNHFMARSVLYASQESVEQGPTYVWQVLVKPTLGFYMLLFAMPSLPERAEAAAT